MVQPVSSFSVPAEYAARESSGTAASPELSAGPVDVVAISGEARQQFRAEMANQAMIRESYREEDAGGSTWELRSGLKAGTYTLKNGNVQKIAIDGDALSIEEFKNGKLVKSVAGTIAEGGMSLDTEYYDSAGRVSQSVHTDIMEKESKEGWTASVMSRDVKWYDGGRLKGGMQDNMLLQTWNSPGKHDQDTARAIKSMLMQGTEAVNTDVDALAQSLTSEKQFADYYAQIKEYSTESGKLAQEIILEQSGRYRQASNRQSEKVAGMEGRTTRELEHNTGLSVHVKNYDAEGDLVREARFSDRHEDKAATSDGTLEQAVAVSWYNKGDLVRQSHGSMTFEETGFLGLPDRPGFLEFFGMDDEEYLGDEPQTALGLMTTKSMTDASEADVFMEGVARHVNDRDYNPAEGIARYGEDQRPYSVSWTDELYRDGELIMRQKDTEGARATSFWQQERGTLFRKAGALTENADPAAVRESSHESEVFKNGRTASHQSMEAREWVDVNLDGPDTIRTTSIFRQGRPGSEDTTVVNGAGTIVGADQDPNAAARGFSGELQQTLDALHGTLASLNAGDADRGLDHRVRPVFGNNPDD